jgi:hypothetical protein
MTDGERAQTAVKGLEGKRLTLVAKPKEAWKQKGWKRRKMKQPKD